VIRVGITDEEAQENSLVWILDLAWYSFHISPSLSFYRRMAIPINHHSGNMTIWPEISEDDSQWLFITNWAKSCFEN
jgi:hypothetical protein